MLKRRPAALLVLSAVLPLTPLVAVSTAGPASGDWDHRVTCGGFAVTVMGTKGADRIKGTKKRDVIFARGGNDVIRSLAGNDVVCAGPGGGSVDGGSGRDRIELTGGNAVGGPGADTIIRSGRATGVLEGGPGNDDLTGGERDDVLIGGPGSDRITDRSGDNQIFDDAGRNVIRLGSGIDRVESTAGHLDVRTGGGDDTVLGAGQIDTGSGVDYVSFKDCVRCGDVTHFDVALGSGDDSFVVGEGEAPTGSPDPATLSFNIDAGEGADSMAESIRPGGTGTTTVVLGDAGSLAGWWEADLNGFENYTASNQGTSQAFHVTGSDASNTITVFGSASQLFGLGGDDVLNGEGAAQMAVIDGGDGTDFCTPAVTRTNCEVG